MLNDILNDAPVFGSGLLLMAAGWLGYQLRALPARLFELLRARCTRVIQIRDRHPQYEAWLRLLTAGAIRKGGPRWLELRAPGNDVQSGVTPTLVAGSGEFWARVCNKWCRVNVGREESAGDGHDLVRRFIINVEVVWATRTDLARFITAARQYTSACPDRTLLDVCDKWGGRTTRSMPRRTPATLCLPAGFYDRLEARLREFLASRTAYESVGIPWRFGVLLYGAPGTGKTSLAHTLASSLERRLAVVPLADLRSDEELVSAFDGVLDESIVLIEDVDCAFRERKSADADGVSFSGFLNCIDGLLAPHNGRILIMSTNHVDRLDPALIRPGRVDLRLEMPLLTRAAAADYVDRVFAHVAARHDIVTRVMTQPQPTAALLLNELLRHDWRRPNAAPAAVGHTPA